MSPHVVLFVTLNRPNITSVAFPERFGERYRSQRGPPACKRKAPAPDGAIWRPSPNPAADSAAEQIRPLGPGSVFARWAQSWCR